MSETSMSGFTQDLLAELMTQVGPVRQVHMPQDRVSQTHQGYGFVEFDTPNSADYASRFSTESASGESPSE